MNQTETLQRILSDISMLSSDRFAGRLSGTSGALGAAKYLAESLHQIGASPAGVDGYLTSLNVSAARLIGPARLMAEGQQLKHRIDFAEWSPFSSGGNVNGELVTVRFDEDVDAASLAGKIVLVPNRPNGFDLAGTVEAAAEIGIAALLIESGEPKWFHKTAFGRENNQIPVLRLHRRVAEQYADVSGIRVEITLPLETRILPCNNVLGLLPGRDADTTLLLAAHYDHIGDDPAGLRFPGSIDNASGVAVMLEVARQLAKEAELPFNVLIAFVTGEESGMRGASDLAACPPVPITMAINLDCLGFEPELIALRTGHSKPGDWLADLAAKVIQQRGIEAQWIAGGDDSSAFLKAGIPTIGLGQKPALESSVRIHTAEDDPEHLHVKPLTQGLSVILDIIRELSHMDSRQRAAV